MTLIQIMYIADAKKIYLSTVQISHNLNGPRVSHTCHTLGVNHTHMGFLDSTHMYTHTQYLHTRVHAHSLFTLACVFTRVHACMANVASMLAIYLSTS